MQKITESLNRSHKLGQIITFMSSRLANYRGVPILAGVILLIVSLSINVLAILLDAKTLYLLGTVTLHVALLSAGIGVMLAEPLGKG